jgi:transposase
MPAGRPTDYDPAFCEDVIRLGRQGKSIEQIAYRLFVAVSTMYKWRDEHPEFSEALAAAKEYEQAYWEDLADSHIVETKDGPRLNATIWSRSMAARFPKKYREQVKQEITGANDAPLLQGINVTFVKPNGNGQG